MRVALVSMLLAMAGTGIVVFIWVIVHLSAQRRLGAERLVCHLDKKNQEDGVTCCRSSISCDLQTCGIKRDDLAD